MRQGNQTIRATGAPAVYCLQDANSTRVAVHVIGADQRIWSTVVVISNTTVDTFYSWSINNGFTAALLSGPAIASLNGSKTHVFAKGGDDRLYVQIIGSTLFQLLNSEQISGSPAATWSNNERLELFYRDKSNQIWHQYKIGNVWYPRQLIPNGETSGALSVVSRNSSTLDLFARGPAYTLYHKRFSSGVWSNWIDLGGNLLSGPGATVYASSARMMVFVTGKTDGKLYYRAWAP